MNRLNPWDVSASGLPVGGGQVPFYNPAQFQQHLSTGSAVASSGTLSTAGHAAAMNVAANYPYEVEHGLHNNWNNFGAWPHVQGYGTTGYGGNYYYQQQQQHPVEPAASLSEGGDVGTYHSEMACDPNWSTNQSYEPYAMQYANTNAYNYDPSVVGGYHNLAAGTVDSFSGSADTLQLYASHAFEDSDGMSPFFHPGDGVSLDTLQPPQLAPHNVATEGVEEFASGNLPAVSSFNNINYQPSPFDELTDMNLKSHQTSLPEQSVFPSAHSRQSSVGGGVQFVIGGSSNVSESQSRTDSPHALAVEAACVTERDEKDDRDNTKSRTVVIEHAGMTQPHFTDAGSHKNQFGRVDGSPVHSLPPQGTMAGTPASSHSRKLIVGPGTPLEHAHVAPDFAERPFSDTDATKTLPCSTNTELVFPAAGVSDDSSSYTQPSHSVDGFEMFMKAADDGEHHSGMYAGPLGSHPDSPFTPVGNALAVTSILNSDSPVLSLPPQGTMAGTPASTHPRKQVPGLGTRLEHPYIAPDFSEPPFSEADASHMLPCSTLTDSVHPEDDISEDSHQPSHAVDDFEMLAKAADIHTSPFGSHPGSLFTPVGNASTTDSAILPGQHITASHSYAMQHMQTSSVCPTAGSDAGALDMQEIELDAVVDSGRQPEAVRHFEAGSNVQAADEQVRVGSGTYKQNVHDASIRSQVHHHVKAHRDATMSPATTLWENPEPTGIRLLPAPAVLAESRNTTDRLPTHELPQNTDAGPSKSGASSIIHETSLGVHLSVHSAEDQLIPQTPVGSSVLLQNSHAFSIDSSALSPLACEFTEQPIVQPDIDLGSSSVVQYESVDSDSVSHYSHLPNNVPLKPLHVVVPQISGQLLNEDVNAVPAGNVEAGNDVIQGHESSHLRPSVGNEVEHTHVKEARQTQNAGEQIATHPADHGQHCDSKNSQQNAHKLQNENNSIHQDVPQRGSGNVQSLSQKSHNLHEAHGESYDAAHAMKSKQQHLPNSVSDAPDERHRVSRYTAEDDRPRSRQDDVEQVSRRSWSRQGYDDRSYDRPRSRQDYDDWGYDGPRSRPGYDHAYGYEQPRSRQVYEDPYGRPRSRQGYEDPHYYRPGSRQGYDDRRDVPHAEQNYSYPGDRRQHRPAYEDERDRPSSRHSYHEPVDRPRSRQEYDRRPRSRQDYEDWSDRGSRDHAGTRRDNQYGNSDSPGSKQELIDKHRDPRQTRRYPDDSFDRSRYNAADERDDRTSWHGNPDNPSDSRYRASHGYREDEYRQPRSRGGKTLCRNHLSCILTSDSQHEACSVPSVRSKLVDQKEGGPILLAYDILLVPFSALPLSVRTKEVHLIPKTLRQLSSNASFWVLAQY